MARLGWVKRLKEANMCLVNAHARLKTQYNELRIELENRTADFQTKWTTSQGKLSEANLEIRKLNGELVSLTPIPIVPVTDLIMISRRDYLAKMLESGIKPLSEGDPMDNNFSLTSKEELDRIAPELVFPVDLCVVDINDCEDGGLKAQCKAADYHVSGIRLALGDMPLGYHGFVITMDKEYNKWCLETLACYEYAGEWFPIGDFEYFPEKVFV